MIKQIIDVLESTLGAAVAKFLFALVLVAWLTYWGTSKAIEIKWAFEKHVRSQDASISLLHQEISTNMAEIHRRINQVEHESWTLRMMIERDRITAEWNPTNRLPDPYRIWRDVREGRVPTGVRIAPQ